MTKTLGLACIFYTIVVFKTVLLKIIVQLLVHTKVGDRAGNFSDGYLQYFTFFNGNL